MSVYKEFNLYLYDRIKTKLEENKEYELLSFALISIHLMLRSSDAIDLEWEQIDIEKKVINNVKQNKRSNQIGENVYVSYSLDDDLISILEQWKDKSNDENKIFPNLKRFSCTKRIGELIGTDSFNSHDLRKIGLHLSV